MDMTQINECPSCHLQLQGSSTHCPNCGKTIREDDTLINELTNIPTPKNNEDLNQEDPGKKASRLFFTILFSACVALLLSYWFCYLFGMISSFSDFLGVSKRSYYSTDGINRIIEEYADYLMESRLLKARIIVLVSGLVGSVTGFFISFYSNKRIRLR